VVKVWASTPSATAPAVSVIRSPTAAIQTGGGPYGFGPGEKNGDIRVWR
jgi:hypothetical protein